MAVDQQYRWRLRLLASVDLIGSTDLKHLEPSSDDGLPLWRLVLPSFYREFTACLRGRYGGGTDPAPMELWKFNGDEILYQSVLTDHRQILPHLRALRDAVKGFGDWWAQQRHGASKEAFPCALKATAWVAGFPVTNQEVQLLLPGAERAGQDFIGPQIDLGFRLSEHATRERLVIDAGAAHLLCSVLPEYRGADIYLGYGGRQPLRGLLQGQAYPLFWIDVPWPDTELERGLADTTYPCEPGAVLKFLNHLFATTSGVRRPFIDGDPDYGLSGREQDEFERNRQLIQEYEQGMELDLGLAAPPTAARPEPPDDEIHEAPPPAD